MSLNRVLKVAFDTRKVKFSPRWTSYGRLPQRLALRNYRSAQSRPLTVKGLQPLDTYVMVTRDEIYRLLDGVPDDRLRRSARYFALPWKQA
jgi:hypothetical protein